MDCWVLIGEILCIGLSSMFSFTFLLFLLTQGTFKNSTIVFVAADNVQKACSNPSFCSLFIVPFYDFILMSVLQIL